jgi:uncharacterized protein
MEPRADSESVISEVWLKDGQLRPIWRFVLAVIFVLMADAVADAFSFGLVGRHLLVADALYRVIELTLLVAGFSLLLRWLDEDGRDIAAALTLPLRRSSWREFLTGFTLGMLMITLAVAAIAVFGHLEFGVRMSAVLFRRTAEVMVLLLAGAVMEELIFRGYPFQKLIESTGPVIATLVFAIFFGAVHLRNPNSSGILSWGFFNTMLISVLFAMVYLRTGTLWAPFGLHLGWNLTLGALFGLPVSGLGLFSTFVHGTASGPKLLTGGSYGIEASLTGAVVASLGFLSLPLFHRVSAPAMTQETCMAGEQPLS